MCSLGQLVCSLGIPTIAQLYSLAFHHPLHSHHPQTCLFPRAFRAPWDLQRLDPRCSKQLSAAANSLFMTQLDVVGNRFVFLNQAATRAIQQNPKLLQPFGKMSATDERKNADCLWCLSILSIRHSVKACVARELPHVHDIIQLVLCPLTHPDSTPGNYRKMPGCGLSVCLQKLLDWMSVPYPRMKKHHSRIIGSGAMNRPVSWC